MASNPGLLSDWPWKKLGSYKYVILAPWVVTSTYMYFNGKKDLSTFLIFPFLLLRVLHNQLWISLSRYRTAKGTTRILDRPIDFDQVDRESNWDDNILLNGLLYYLFAMTMDRASNLPIWRTDGVVMTFLLHVGPVEFLYYWLHRALHHHYLYSRYHSHHHSSIVTEPITSVIHPFAEHLMYFLLFAIPLLPSVLTGTASVFSMFGYIIFIDLMNNMGHCNFELIPKWLFSIFPPLKYLMYTPSYHSLHHTQFRTNYSLFIPIYDFIYGTMDKSSDTLYKTSLERQEESPDVVHLTQLTTPESIYHLQTGLASFSSNPYDSTKWYLQLLLPLTFVASIITSFYTKTFIAERNVFRNLKLQSWAMPRLKIQYIFAWQRKVVNDLIEEAILDAESKGTKVISLGLLNQVEELNEYGEIFVKRFPELRVKIVDGSSLATAIVLHSIPQGTAEVLLIGKLSKVAYAIIYALCQKDIQVTTTSEDEYMKLKMKNSETNLFLSKSYSQKIWLVGDGLTEEEQGKASKGTWFIPFSTFPPKRVRKDCFYLQTPAMLSPPSLENLHSCENWLPRRVISASRVTGILHGLEGWKEHECRNGMLNYEKVWKASLKHGFQPLINPNEHNPF